MLKPIIKILGTLLCIFILTTCIDPYYPELGKYKSLLVVEGLLTDSNTPVTVRLTRTFLSLDSVPEEISDANIYITDNADSRADLFYSGDGIYESDANSGFTGQTGKTYTLHIETKNGEKYLSEPCLMLPVPGIDSLYYSRDEELDKTSGITKAGIKILLDTDKDWGDEGFLRWEYEETWKFKVPSQKEYIYVSDTEIIKLNNITEYCFKNHKSSEILINPILPNNSFLTSEPLVFIPSSESDRLNIQYSILVRQFSISSKEFNFWNNLKQVNETGGNIFDTQPYPVISNIYNVDNADEKVLGYFRVSAVKEKRIFITTNDIKELDLPTYNYPCNEFVVSPDTYYIPGAFGNPPTWDEINEMFMAAGGFAFIRPIYVGETDVLMKLVFADEKCSDCSLTGSIAPPDFWIDLP